MLHAIMKIYLQEPYNKISMGSGPPVLFVDHPLRRSTIPNSVVPFCVPHCLHKLKNFLSTPCHNLHGPVIATVYGI